MRNINLSSKNSLFLNKQSQYALHYLTKTLETVIARFPQRRPPRVWKSEQNAPTKNNGGTAVRRNENVALSRCINNITFRSISNTENTTDILPPEPSRTVEKPSSSLNFQSKTVRRLFTLKSVSRNGARVTTCALPKCKDENGRWKGIKRKMKKEKGTSAAAAGTK